MKKVLLIIVLILNFQISFSQSNNSWLDSNSNWHYSIWYVSSNYSTGYNHYYYAQDTVINGRVFQEVKCEQQLRTTNNGSYILGDRVMLPSKYFYTSNDTVYVLTTSNTLQFVWNNNPNVGDIWDFGLQFDASSNNYIHAYSKVDSIKSVTINGQILKDIYSQPCKDSIGTPFLINDIGLFSNHISCINSKFGPKYGFNIINTFILFPIVDDSNIPDNLLCFQSSTFPFYQVGNTDCTNGILTGELQMNKNGKVFSFPNPASTKIFFKGLRPEHQIKIFNQLGVVQSFYSNNSFPLDISELIQGLYFYAIYDKHNNLITNGKFIKE